MQCSSPTHQSFQTLKTGWNVCRDRLCQSFKENENLWMQFSLNLTWTRGRYRAWWVFPSPVEALCGAEARCRTSPWCTSRLATWRVLHPLTGAEHYVVKKKFLSEFVYHLDDSSFREVVAKESLHLIHLLPVPLHHQLQVHALHLDLGEGNLKEGNRRGLKRNMKPTTCRS